MVVFCYWLYTAHTIAVIKINVNFLSLFIESKVIQEVGRLKQVGTWYSITTVYLYGWGPPFRRAAIERFHCDVIICLRPSLITSKRWQRKQQQGVELCFGSNSVAKGR